MPIYEYVCGDCGQEFELLVRGSEKLSCPSCGKSKLNKQLSVPAAHMAGGADVQCAAREAGACDVSGGGCCGGGCGMGGPF
jgi:putative FmdB family regulatory protein